MLKLPVHAVDNSHSPAINTATWVGGGSILVLVLHALA